MALNRKVDFGREEDELEVLRDKYLMLEREKESLQKQVKALQEKQKAPKAPRQPKKSSIFLIIAALLVAARLVLFIVVEAWGQRASNLSPGLSAGFGFTVICMILIWSFHDWRADGWTVAGSLIFLFVAILVCVSTYDPVLLETGALGPVQRPVVGALALISSLLFAATRTFRWIMGWLLVFVTDPKGAFKR
jgi:peptidoglycan/LPS O-acetylase OafA/YrhL